MSKLFFIQVVLKDHIRDVAAEQVKNSAQRYLHIHTGRVKSSKLFTLNVDISKSDARRFAEDVLCDPVMQDFYLNTFFKTSTFKRYLLVSKLPGVTDDEGISAQKALSDLLNRELPTNVQMIYTGDVYYFEKDLNDRDLLKIGEELLGNPLINHFETGAPDKPVEYIPDVKMESVARIETIPIDLDDKSLLSLSSNMLLSLNLEEMKAIRDYFS
ncbi:MAG TPA: phosphoribosylformylglycinamidine synthase, partial [Candidatus Marinimicrobia bacterium]|nr:phosphoribosylformylglycinamidine synthase [Candidatus Neomarinimicrobiota bacterium]